nr:MAG TPA: hypothetical protein [Caudoviricetes sp.]
MTSFLRPILRQNNGELYAREGIEHAGGYVVPGL